MRRGPWAGRVGKIVKGMFVALALDAALSENGRISVIVLTVLGAILALAVGEIYASAVEAEFRLGRRITSGEVRTMVADAVFILIGALPSMLLFVLASLGAFSPSTAADIALLSGIGFLGFLGLSADRLNGNSGRRAVLHAVELAVLGGAVLLLKSLLY